MPNNTPSNFLVVLGSINGRTIYLGELDPGVRSGVTKVENAVRFTKRGAMQVALQYPDASVIEHGEAELLARLAKLSETEEGRARIREVLAESDRLFGTGAVRS